MNVYWILVVLPILLLIGAIILRLACWICGVAVPPFLYAVWVVFLTSLVVVLVTVVVNIGLEFAAANMRLTNSRLRLGAGLLGFPLHLLVAAGMYSAMLKVGFARGIIIRLAEIFFIVVLGLIVLGVVLWARGGLQEIGM